MNIKPETIKKTLGTQLPKTNAKGHGAVMAGKPICKGRRKK